MYQIVSDSTVKRVEDSVFVPVDESNTDYQAYLTWVAEGNTALPWPPEE